MPLGFYAIVFADHGQFSRKKGQVGHIFTQVSNLAFFRRTGPQNQPEFLLVHRKTGEPLEGVTAEFFYTEYRRRNKTKTTRTGSVKSDKDGLVRPQKGAHDNLEIRFSQGDDELFLTDRFGFYSYRQRNQDRSYCQFFLDRAIYRPGQTLYL